MTSALSLKVVQAILLRGALFFVATFLMGMTPVLESAANTGVFDWRFFSVTLVASLAAGALAAIEKVIAPQLATLILTPPPGPGAGGPGGGRN